MFTEKMTYLYTLIHQIRTYDFKETEEVLDLSSIEKVLIIFENVDEQIEDLPKELIEAFSNFLNTYIEIFESYLRGLQNSLKEKAN